MLRARRPAPSLVAAAFTAAAGARPVAPVAAPWRWALAGALLGLLGALILFAPARWLAQAAAAATGERLLLAEPRGSLWRGSARLVLSGGAGSRDAAALPSRVSWRLAPGWGTLRLTLAAPCCTPQPLVLAVTPRWGGLRVAVPDGPPSQWPASLLAGLGTPWNTLQLDGQLQLATQGLSLEWADGAARLSGQAELQALGLSSRLSTLRPMGSYRVTLQQGNPPQVNLSTLSGSLELSGSGQLAGGRLRFTGQASAAPEREAALANLLNIIGRRNGARSLITIG